MKIRKSTVLAAVSMAGVVGTAVLSALGYQKMNEKLVDLHEQKEDPQATDILKVVVPTIGPAVVMGVATIGCIGGLGYLTKEQEVALTGAVEVVKSQFDRYRQSAKDIYGEDADAKIIEGCIHSNPKFHIQGLDYPDQKHWFHEPYSDQWIFAYEREIIDAEYHLNRNFCLRGMAPLAEWLYFLGLESERKDEERLWTASAGYYWVDFEHRLGHDKKHGDYYDIYTMFEPDEDEYDELNSTYINYDCSEESKTC